LFLAQGHFSDNAVSQEVDAKPPFVNYMVLESARIHAGDRKL